MLNRFKFENHPNYMIKKPFILYIDRYGYIYPDCKVYKSAPICHILDKDTTTKINNKVFGDGQTGIFNMITVEFSSICHANCIYCFQNDSHKNDKYLYYNEVFKLLNNLKSYWYFFSGGEILVQNDSMQFIKDFKIQNPEAWVHLKTNGNASLDKIDFVNNYCDSIMVSFNGFSNATYSTIMGLDIELTKEFCKHIKQCGKINLGLKLLNSPLTIAETPEFLNWALSLDAKCICIQLAYNYELDKFGKNIRYKCILSEKQSSIYWSNVYDRISLRCKKILKKYLSEINMGSKYLAADKELFDYLNLDNDYTHLFRTDGVYIIE